MTDVDSIPQIAQIVRARLGDGVLLPSTGGLLAVSRVHYLRVLSFLKSDPDTELEMLVDLFALDHLSTGGSEREDGRFEVRALLRSATLGYRAQVACMLPPGEPMIPTLSGLFASAWALERELFEMHGVIADGHPSLRPLYLYDGFAGHPLRRDYRAHKEQPLVPLLDDVPAPTLILESGEGA